MCLKWPYVFLPPFVCNLFINMLDSDADDDECDDGGSGDHDGYDSIMKFESMHVFLSFECENKIITVSF